MADQIWYQGGKLIPVTGGSSSLAALIGKPVSKKTSGAYNEVAQTAAGAAQWGVLVDYDGDSPTEGLMLVGGITYVTLGGTLSAGDEFEWNSSGQAVAVSTGVPAGFVLEAGGANDVKRVWLYEPSGG